MSRAKRIFGEGITYHVMSNCNNGEFLFAEGRHFALFLHYLRAAKQKFGFDLNAYSLLQSHIHLILTTKDHFLNLIMHWLCHSYSEQYNKLHGRKGHFWRERYKAKIVGNDLYGLGLLRYVHRNSLEAGLVKSPEEWPWSCYSHYAFGAPNDLITPLPSYLTLADDSKSRFAIYQRLVQTLFVSEEVEQQLFHSKLQSNSLRQNRIIKREFEPFLTLLKA